MRKKGDEAEDKKAKPGGINQLAMPNRAKKVSSLLRTQSIKLTSRARRRTTAVDPSSSLGRKCGRWPEKRRKIHGSLMLGSMEMCVAPFCGIQSADQIG